MKAIVFALLKKDANDKTWRDTRTSILNDAKPAKEIVELGEGSWLIPEKHISPFLGLCISYCETDNSSYRVFTLADGFDWERRF